MDLTNPGRALGRFSVLSISRKLLALSGIPSFFHRLILAGLPPCFARWAHSFLSDRRACVVYQSRSFRVFSNHKSRSFRVRRDVPQGSVLGYVLFSLFISKLPASLSSFVSCSLYADDLAICSSSPSVPTAVEARQGALI